MFLLAARNRCISSHHLRFTHHIRSYAQRSGASPVPPRPLLKPQALSLPPSLPVKAATPQIRSGSGPRMRKINLVQDLYNAGDTSLYKAPHRLTYFRLQCWTVAGLCAAYLGWSFKDKIYKPEALKERGIDYPLLLAGTNVVIGTFLMAAMFFSLYRTRNHVHAIDLVKQSDAVMVRLSVREPVPFLKRHIILKPYSISRDLHINPSPSPPIWMRPHKLNEASVSALIVSVLGNTARSFPRLFWNVYATARHFITLDGTYDLLALDDQGKQELEIGYILDARGLYLTANERSHLFRLFD